MKTGYKSYLESLSPPQSMDDVIGNLVYEVDDPRALPLLRIQDVLCDMGQERRVGRCEFTLLDDLSFVPVDFVFYFLAPFPPSDDPRTEVDVHHYRIYSHKAASPGSRSLKIASVDSPPALIQTILDGFQTDAAQAAFIQMIMESEEAVQRLWTKSENMECRSMGIPACMRQKAPHTIPQEQNVLNHTYEMSAICRNTGDFGSTSSRRAG